jgi:hypothetical protein
MQPKLLGGGHEFPSIACSADTEIHRVRAIAPAASGGADRRATGIRRENA